MVEAGMPRGFGSAHPDDLSYSRTGSSRGIQGTDSAGYCLVDIDLEQAKIK